MSDGFRKGSTHPTRCHTATRSARQLVPHHLVVATYIRPKAQFKLVAFGTPIVSVGQREVHAYPAKTA
jgi:hypothetical protein